MNNTRATQHILLRCRRIALIYDIRHKEHDAVPSLTAPTGVPCKSEAENGELTSWLSWDYLGGGIVLDSTHRVLRQLCIDMGAVLDDFLSRPPHDVAVVLKLLLRRAGCRDYVVQLLRKALASKTKSAELSQGFQVLNAAYRQVIEAMSQRSANSRQATISLQELEAQITDQSILSEKDAVTQVFYPHFVESEGLTLADSSNSWCIPVTVRRPSRTSGRSPYILSVVISYLRSLLGLQILPHKILQCFVFDLCVYFRRASILKT